MRCIFPLLISRNLNVFFVAKRSTACLDMYNKSNEHKSLGASPPPPPVSPRISFSNDFVECSHSSHHLQMTRAYRDAPVSSDDFEFSVPSYSMMSADELFFKGKFLPFKEESFCSNQVQKTTTLRDELQVEDDDDNFSLKPPKSSTRWKALLALKRPHIGSKKIDKTEGTVLEKRSNMIHEDAHSSKNLQESYSRNFEFRI